jgi:hypothetical protein
MTTPAAVAGGATFDVTAAERELRQEETYARNGHAARTLVVQPDLRIVLVAMMYRCYCSARCATSAEDASISAHIAL